MGFKSDAQRRAAFAKMSKTKKARLRRAKRVTARRVGAAFGLKPAQPTPTKVNNPISPSDGKRHLVTCPNCGSSNYKYLGLAPLNSKSYSAAIPQVVGFDYTSYENVAYYTCNNCNTPFYSKPVSAL